MSSTTISHPSFSIPLFTQLVRRLRLTNARYHQIAYQWRRVQHSTYHAKRRAYRVGLHIDTSKARTAWPDDHVDLSVSVSAASTQSFPALDGTAGSPVWVAAEIETETGMGEDGSDWSAEDALPNPWPEPQFVVREQPMVCLSPLGLGLRNVDDLETCNLLFRGPVPGAPRWRSKPLPEDEGDHGMETMTNESVSPEVLCTYDRVWRGIMNTHVSGSVSIPVDVIVDGGHGIMVQARHLKRKLRDFDVDGSAMFSKRREVGMLDDEYFSGAWWSETRRRRGGP